MSNNHFSDYILSINNVSYSYNKSITLDSINLNVKCGEILSIIGPNGCGKSTLLKLSSGLINDTKSNNIKINDIKINNKHITDYSRKELARTISVLPQSRDIANISVERLVEHGRFPYLNMSRQLSDKDHEIINHAIAVVGIENLRHKNIGSLSGGERQRAYIAMVLAQDTPIILMDEPTTYLDIYHQFELMELISELNSKYNKTIILVLHDISLAMKYSSHIAVMNTGKIIYDGVPDDLINRHSDILHNTFHINCNKITINNSDEYIITPSKY